MSLARMDTSLAGLSGAITTSTGPGATSPVSRPDNKSFSKLLDELRLKDAPGSQDLHAELMKVEQRVLNGGSFEFQELLRFQVLAGRFGVAVELVTKVADAALQTTRKFQQQQ